MTVQFSRQAIPTLSSDLLLTGSGLVRRLVRAQNDPGKERVRTLLIELDDAQLQSGLGLTPEDIAVLRAKVARAGRQSPQSPQTFSEPSGHCKPRIRQGTRT